jgi:hypothetical protein
MAEKIKCSKCGKMIDTRGIVMHENFCKEEKKEDKPKKINSKKSISECIECRSNNIKRLDDLEKTHDIKKILEMGYTHFCVDCGELLK